MGREKLFKIFPATTKKENLKILTGHHLTNRPNPIMDTAKKFYKS